MDTAKTCPKCGKPLAANAPAGLCPECLMQAGFPTGTEPDPGTKKHRFQPPSMEELKPHFSQLEILSYIGQGGMGAVYKARQPMLDRYVALKILPPEASSSPGFTERFTREARALARLNHPNIVSVYEFGQSGGYYYLLMEFVDGVNLREMERAQRLLPAQALSIVPKICEALQYAHDEGVVHRDIKPENILVDKKGRVKIADFGIAKILGAETNDRITGAQHVVGTPHYMAPEQVEKPLSVDHRADIYSLGVVFYEMLTGELPLGRFAAPSKKVQIDVRLDDVVLRALEKEPEQRYQQASVFKTQVETIATDPREPARGAGPSAEPAALKAAEEWLAFVDARNYSASWEDATRFRGAFTKEDWIKKLDQVRLPLGRMSSRKLVKVKKFSIPPGLSTGSRLTVTFTSCFAELNAATEMVCLLLTSSGRWKTIGYRIHPQFAKSRAGLLGSFPIPQERWLRPILWIVAALLFLNFALPHTRDFNRFGLSQPWIFLPDSAHGTIFNPFSTSFYSGIISLLLAIVLFSTRGKATDTLLSRRRLYRWATAVLLAVLVAVGIRAVVIEPFKAMNDAVAPEITPGSRVFVYKLARDFKPGDIVVYRYSATGKFDKYLLGRVAEYPDNGQVSIERRHEAALRIAIGDVVGKVIFNTRSDSPYNRPTPTFGPVVERTLNDLATKTNCALNLITGELLTPPPDILEYLYPIHKFSKPSEYQKMYNTVGNWCRENDVHLIGPVTRTPHLNALAGLDDFGPAQWSMSVEDLTNFFLQPPPGALIGSSSVPVAVETRADNSGTYAFKTVYGALGLFKILSTNKWPNPSITIKYKVLRDGNTDMANNSPQPDPTNAIPLASAELWAPSPMPTNSMGVHKVLDDAQKLADAGEYEKALQHYIWYYNHALEIDGGQSGVRGSFALSYWMDLGEKYPKALQALAEIRDDTAERLRVGHGGFKTFMDLHNLNGELKDDEGTYAVFKTIEQHDSHLAKQCYPIIEDMFVAKGEYQTSRKYIDDPQAKYERIRHNYEMEMGTAKRMATFQAKINRDIAAVQARIASNAPPTTVDENSILRSIPSRGLMPPDPSAALPRFAQERFVTEVCRLIEILLATGSPEKAEDILRQAKEVLQSPKFDSAIDDAKQRIAAHKTQKQSGQGFSVGQQFFPRGDSIELTSVERSSGQIIVKGHYKLVSAQRATLALNITTSNAGYTKVAPQQSKHITSGSGDFELIHPNPTDGSPHVAMYGDDGVAFANLYFQVWFDLNTEFSARTTKPKLAMPSGQKQSTTNTP